MDISIIIPVTRQDALLKCLTGFNQQQTTYKYEVIAVGSVPKKINAADYSFKLSLIECDDLHANVRRNIGVRNASSNIIGLMDDDCIPNPLWVENAVKCSQIGLVTGPEIPDNTEDDFTKLQFNILSSKFSEFTLGHINSIKEKIKWYDVAFCNCIIPRKAWELANEFSEIIPWDMDDFHFCYNLKSDYLFYNQPELLVKHDRYPDSFKKLMNYKWKLRKRTGEKLITHSEIYCRIPSVLLAALAPYLILMFCFSVPLIVLCFSLLMYLIPPIFIYYKTFHYFHLNKLFTALLIYFGVHIITVLAIQIGILKALLNKFI